MLSMLLSSQSSCRPVVLLPEELHAALYTIRLCAPAGRPKELFFFAFCHDFSFCRKKQKAPVAILCALLSVRLRWSPHCQFLAGVRQTGLGLGWQPCIQFMLREIVCVVSV